MENDAKIKEMRNSILKKIKTIEINNYSQKPGGKSDNEMVEIIKKIIEIEVDKCL